MPNVARKLNLSKTQIDTIRQSNLWQKRELTEDEQNYLIALLVGGTPNNQSYVDTIVADFADILKEESHFYNGIAEKLGYKDRTIVGQKSTQDLGKETLEEQKDTAFLDNIEQAQERQLKEQPALEIRIRRYGQSYARISGFTFLIRFLLFTILFSDYLFTDNLSIFSYRHFLRQICVN